MPTPLRRQLRIARRSLAYTVAAVLILMAVVLGIASQVLPMAERNPERIEAWLTQRAGRPVAFERVKTEWTRRGPLLRLDGLRVGEGAQTITIGDAEMLVSMYAGLLPGQAFSELRLHGLDLTLERHPDGRWQVRGLPGQQQPGADPLSALEGLGELQVIDGRLAVIAPSLSIDARIPKIDLRLRVNGDRVHAGVRAWPQTSAMPLDVVLDFNRKRGDGRAYAGSKKADIAAWSQLLRVAGVVVESGHGRAESWAELRGHRIAEVTVNAKLDNVGLQGAPLGQDITPLRTSFAHVEGKARWRLVEGGWRLDAPTLRIGQGDSTQQLDGLVLAGGEQYAVLADKLDAAPLIAVAALSDKLSPDLRRWLRAAQPSASLQRIEVVGRRGGAMHARARIDSIGFAPVDKAPGLRGLSGDIDGDADGFSVRLDPQGTTQFDWPHGFGLLHTLKLRGDVGVWREGESWRVGTSALRIEGETNGHHYNADARGGLRWQGDGTRPWIDIAAEIGDAPILVAKGFWLRKDMQPVAVKWLDNALVGGVMRNGRGLVSGDLDDWPFRDRNGRFEATGHISGGVIKFQPDWPATETLDADVSFVADGFTVDGTARLAGVGMRQVHAGIDHYGGGALVVQALAASDSAQMLSLLKQSPLRKEHAETFANLSTSGPAEATFDLNLPLKKGSEMAIKGGVDLRNAKLADARWKLAFDQVNGHAEYSRDGFNAADLSVRHDGQPGKLSLRAGTEYVRDKANVFEAGLEAALAADALLDRAPELEWLKPHLDGRSEWMVGIAIPKTAKGVTPITQLQLRSNLVGTALTLPAPLSKPANEALLATVETPLPMGSADIKVALGDVMALRARTGNGQTGVRVALGTDRVDEAAPASGLIATGRAGALDAIEWIAFTRGGEGKSSLPLRRIDVTAQRLQLLGGEFADTHVIVVPAERGATAMQAEGAALQGALLIADGESANIAGRFDRVHWKPFKAPIAPARVTAGEAVAQAVDDSVDPAKIPALAIDITDLRILDANLGNTKLRTKPSVAGMHIEQLQTRADMHRIDLSGDWAGRGATARTKLTATVDSEDFGGLLNGFGVGGRIGGGEGSVRFDASWPGSPASFQLAGLDGTLALDVRDGRLLEVEPGAGRVLGLLSLAQLPRRLTLDFRDFFSKGFAFNSLDGTVRFGGGSARSDDLQIDGPAAVIDIRGAANLRTQSFDQTIEVRPKAGNLLTAVGALAGGPVGAAIGAAANAVLQKPLGQMASKTYRVTGPWKEPKVEVLTREQSRVSAATPSPSG